jgi:CRP-like cAMP-binding protein
LPQQPNYLWRIEQGIVRSMTWGAEGGLTILGYWGPGNVVGQALSRINPYHVECLTSVEASLLPADLWHQALDALLLHVQQVEELLSIAYTYPTDQRLFKHLVWLAQTFGREVSQGKLIDLPLTHQDIAEGIGAARTTVTVLLNQLEQKGAIIRFRRQIILSSKFLVL